MRFFYFCETVRSAVELMVRLAEDDKEGVISDKVLQVLWILITGRDSRTEIIDLTLSSLNSHQNTQLHLLSRCLSIINNNLILILAS